MDQAILDKLTEINTNIDALKLLIPLNFYYVAMCLGIIYGGVMAVITALELRSLK